MLTAIVITAACYGAALHGLRRVRTYTRPAGRRKAIDATLCAAGGGGGPVEPF